MRTIIEVLKERGDLSTFVVHLTRGADPCGNLESILTTWTIEARNCFGLAQARQLAENHPGTRIEASQKVVCFTETPLDLVHLMCEGIRDREVNFAPYGVAFTRTYVRIIGANPVWYVDTTRPQGGFRDWLTNPLGSLIRDAASLAQREDANLNEVADLPILRLTPFIETIGRTAAGKPKEFWWEREWRKVGDMNFLPTKAVVVLAPERDHLRLQQAVDHIAGYKSMRLVDMTWPPQQIESTVANLDAEPFPQ